VELLLLELSAWGLSPEDWLKRNSERERALTLRVFLGSLFVMRGHSGIRFLCGDFQSGRRPASRERSPGPAALQGLSGQLGNVVSNRLD
jgi:hypothetical protein